MDLPSDGKVELRMKFHLVKKSQTTRQIAGGVAIRINVRERS